MESFIELMNDSISIDCKQQILTSANLSKQGNSLEASYDSQTRKESLIHTSRSSEILVLVTST